jgi:hypothetical protein
MLHVSQVNSTLIISFISFPCICCVIDFFIKSRRINKEIYETTNTRERYFGENKGWVNLTSFMYATRMLQLYIKYASIVPQVCFKFDLTFSWLLPSQSYPAKIILPRMVRIQSGCSIEFDTNSRPIILYFYCFCLFSANF